MQTVEYNILLYINGVNNNLHPELYINNIYKFAAWVFNYPSWPYTHMLPKCNSKMKKKTFLWHNKSYNTCLWIYHKFFLLIQIFNSLELLHIEFLIFHHIFVVVVDQRCVRHIIQLDLLRSTYCAGIIFYAQSSSWCPQWVSIYKY